MPPKRPATAAPAAAKSPADDQQLGLKEQTLFKQVLRFYELKQYKKAMKSADLILKKHPLHGETLAMKGLTYNSLGKKEDAHALVKKGLAMNIKSHVCWHVYGLLYRSETKYEDAIKCYQNAIKRDVNNLQILKDLSNLQIQRRMLDGFTESRRRILVLKSNNKHNWLAYAIGNHLTGNYEKALQILDALQNTDGMGERAPNDKRPPTYDESEMHLYRAQILEEAGKFDECLTYLEENRNEIIDKLHLLEKRGQLQIKAGKLAEAEKDYRFLLSQNPENYAYHLGLHKALGFVDATNPALKSFNGIEYTEESAKALLDLYATDPLFKPVDQWTKVAAVKRLPLHFTRGATFKQLLEAYLKSGDYARALALVDESVAHTPTPPDSYMLKARIFKHAGDPITAYGYMEQARRLDTQDRYLNTKCVRYALRADELRKAEETVSLFLRDGDGLKALSDLQVMWYENTAAELHMRARSYGRALKQLLSVDKHFVDILEDQFDFHAYCLRKTTLRAYVDTIRWGNTLRGHRFHVRAALNLVRVYLRLYDAPREEAQHFDAMAEASNLSEQERKEEAKRLRKAAAKQKAIEEKAAAAEAAAKLAAMPKGKQQSKAEVDADPDGAALLETAQANPLQEATRFMQYLSAQHANSLQTHTLGVSLYVRKARFLLALRHLSKAMAIDAQHPDTHVAQAEFLHAVRAPGVIDALHPAVQAALNSATASQTFGAGASVAQINDAFLAKHSKSLAARVAVARVLLLLDPVANKARAQTLASQLSAGDATTRVEATDALSFLADTLRAPQDVLDTFKKAALAQHPLAVAFGAKPQPPPVIDAPQA